MEFEIFIHGVPAGASYYGKPEERQFFESFYTTNCSDKEKYLIHTRSLNGKLYAYYHYLVYKDVVGADNRSGSYFGLTIRMEGFCKDFERVYTILKMAFNSCVLGKVLKIQNNGYKYIISDFPKSQDLMSRIEQDTIDFISKTFENSNGNFVSLNGFSAGKDIPLTANLYETTASTIEEMVRAGKKIALSPYYPTHKEKQMEQTYMKEIDALKQRSNDELKEKDRLLGTCQSNLSSFEDENKKLKKELQDKTERVNELQNEKEKLRNQCEKNSQAEQKLARVIEVIGPKSYDSGATAKHGVNHPRSTPRNNAKPLSPILSPSPSTSGEHSWREWFTPSGTKINLLLLLIVCVSLLLLASSMKNVENSLTELKSAAPLSCINDEKDDSNQTQADGFSSTDNDLEIDVKDYDEDKQEYLSPDKEYTARIKGNQNNGSSYTWEITNGSIQGSEKGETVKFCPDSTSENVILIVKDSKGEVIGHRELKMKLEKDD